MNINTKPKKNDDIPAPQIRVRSNVKSGPDTVAPMITDFASSQKRNPVVYALVSNDGKPDNMIELTGFV